MSLRIIQVDPVHLRDTPTGATFCRGNFSNLNARNQLPNALKKHKKMRLTPHNDTADNHGKGLNVKQAKWDGDAKDLVGHGIHQPNAMGTTKVRKPRKPKPSRPLPIRAGQSLRHHQATGRTNLQDQRLLESIRQNQKESTSRTVTDSSDATTNQEDTCSSMGNLR